MRRVGGRYLHDGHVDRPPLDQRISIISEAAAPALAEATAPARPVLSSRNSRISTCRTASVSVSPHVYIPWRRRRNAWQAGWPAERVPHACRKARHVLIVLENRNPLPMFVRRDAVETLQHLVALDGSPPSSQCASDSDRAPDRVRVQDRARVPRPRRSPHGAGLRPTACRPRPSSTVHRRRFRESARPSSSPLDSAAGGDGQPQRIGTDDHAEVAARAQHPAARIEPPANLGQSPRHVSEIRSDMKLIMDTRPATVKATR